MPIAPDMGFNLALSFKDDAMAAGYKHVLDRLARKTGPNLSSFDFLMDWLKDVVKDQLMQVGVVDIALGFAAHHAGTALNVAIPGVGTLITGAIEAAAKKAKDAYYTKQSDEYQKRSGLQGPPQFNVYEDGKKASEEILKVYDEFKALVKARDAFVKTMNTPPKGVNDYQKIWAEYVGLLSDFCVLRNRIYGLSTFTGCMNDFCEDRNDEFIKYSQALLVTQGKGLETLEDIPLVPAKAMAEVQTFLAAAPVAFDMPDSKQFTTGVESSIGRVADAKSKAFLTQNKLLMLEYLSMLGYTEDGNFQGSVKVVVAPTGPGGPKKVYMGGKGKTSGTAGAKLTKDAKDGFWLELGEIPAK